MVEVSSLLFILLAEAAGVFALATLVMIFLTIRRRAKDKKALKQLIANVNERGEAHKADLRGFLKALSGDIDPEVGVACVLGAETQFYQTFLRLYRAREIDLVATLPDALDALVAPYRSIAGDPTVSLEATTAPVDEPADEQGAGSLASDEANEPQDAAHDEDPASTTPTEVASLQAQAEPEPVDDDAPLTALTQAIEEGELEVASAPPATEEADEPALTTAEPEVIDDELEVALTTTHNDLDEMLEAALTPADDAFDDELEVALGASSDDLDDELELALGQDVVIDETLDPTPSPLPAEDAPHLEDEIAALTQDEPLQTSAAPTLDAQQDMDRVEKLTDENTRLAHELEVTRETLNNMLSEYATAFAKTEAADSQVVHSRVLETDIDLDDLLDFDATHETDLDADIDASLDLSPTDLSDDISLDDTKASLAKAS